MQKHIKLSEITAKDGYITCRNVHGTLEVELNGVQQITLYFQVRKHQIMLSY